MELYIEAWEWDDANIGHLDTHGITPEMIEDEIWADEPRFITNRRNRSASHLMIGPDRAGRLWTVCIIQAGRDPGVARDHRMAKQAARGSLVLEGAMNMTMQHNDDEEVARQLERDADDDAMWEQEPVKIERRPSRTSVLSLRLPTAEFHALLSAARDAGESVSGYVRKAIAARMATESPATRISVSCIYQGAPSGGISLEWRTYTAGSARQEEATSSTH